MSSEEVKSWTEAVTCALRGWRKPSNTRTRKGSNSVKIYPGNCRHISPPLLHQIYLVYFLRHATESAAIQLAVQWNSEQYRHAKFVSEGFYWELNRLNCFSYRKPQYCNSICSTKILTFKEMYIHSFPMRQQWQRCSSEYPRSGLRPLPTSEISIEPENSPWISTPCPTPWRYFPLLESRHNGASFTS